MVLRHRNVRGARSVAMKLLLENERDVPALLADLRERVDFVVAQTGPREISVSVLGSFRDGGAAELGEFLRAWRERHPETQVTLEAPSPDEHDALARDLLDRFRESGSLLEKDETERQ
jgi:hypothetical protein